MANECAARRAVSGIARQRRPSRLLGSERIATPSGPAEDALGRIGCQVREFLSRWHARTVIGAAASGG